MSILSLFPAEVRAQVAELMTAAQHGGTPEIEVRALHRSGESFDMHVLASNQGTDSGTCPVVWFGTDISRRKQLERTVTQVLDAGYGRSSTEFLHFLTENLAATLHTDYAFVAELDKSGETARALSFWNRGHFDAVFEYPLADTPCADVAHSIERIGSNCRCCGDHPPRRHHRIRQSGIRKYQWLSARRSCGSAAEPPAIGSSRPGFLPGHVADDFGR